MKSKCLGTKVPTIKCAISITVSHSESFTFSSLNSVSIPLIISIVSLLCVCVWVAQSCLTLCDPMDCGLLGPSVHGILQAIIVDWVAIPLFRGSSWPRDRTQVSWIGVRFYTLWATRVYIYLFHFWLCWVFVATGGLSLVVAGRGYAHCHGLSLQSTGSRREGFSTCSTWLSSCGALLHVASSQTRDRTCVPCIDRQILIHQTTTEVLAFIFDVSVSVLRFVKFI